MNSFRTGAALASELPSERGSLMIIIILVLLATGLEEKKAAG